MNTIETNDKIIVTGQVPLKGKAKVHGAKNSVLPIIISTILSEDGEAVLNNVPNIVDVHIMKEILEDLGFDVDFDSELHRFTVRGKLKGHELPKELCSKIRASTLFMGAMLVNKEEVVITYPGGDKIGDRPIDIHLEAIEKFGVKIESKGGQIIAKRKKLKPADVFLRFPSVGVTEHIMLMAAGIEGETTIRNAAQEPEIVDLGMILGKMGAKVIGAGTSRIKIVGSQKLRKVEHEIIPDRLEAATLLIASLMTKGNVEIEGVVPDHNQALFAILHSLKAKYDFEDENIIKIQPSKLKGPLQAHAMYYPGLATDLQPIVTALATSCEGESIISDIVHLERFSHVHEFRKFGATISHVGNQCRVMGKQNLLGASVRGTDIRSVTSLICMALASEGESEIEGIYHLNRGHTDLIGTLKSLGAKIEVK